MLQVESGEISARVVALQILLNRSSSIWPKLISDGGFGGMTKTAVNTFRDREMAVSGPAGVADPAMWRFLLDRAKLQVIDFIDVTDPMLLDQVVPEVSRWTNPIVIGGLSNGVAQLVQEVKARAKGERSLMMLRLHGHGSPGLAAVSHGSRRVMPGIDPFLAQSVIAQQIMPALTPILQGLGPLFNDFGFVELHSCRVGEAPTGQTFVRQLAAAVNAPVRAALSKQEANKVFTLTGPTFTAVPGGGSLRDWGFSRKEAFKPAGPPAAPTQQPDRSERPRTVISER